MSNGGREERRSPAATSARCAELGSARWRGVGSRDAKLAPDVYRALAFGDATTREYDVGASRDELLDGLELPSVTTQVARDRSRARISVEHRRGLAVEAAALQRCSAEPTRASSATLGPAAIVVAGAEATERQGRGTTSRDVTTPSAPPPWTRIEKRDPSGWGLNMYVLALRDGSTLVHSPTYIDDATYDRVAALGEPSLLFAPTAVHHLSLERYRERFPKAIAVAGRAALSGLAARKHAGVEDIEAHASRLPDGAEIHCAEGTRWGETWISFRDPRDGSSVLLVCDAFFRVGRRVTGGMGFTLRALGIGEELCVGRTFKWAGVTDTAAYKRWASAVIAKVQPTTLLLSHCEPPSSPALPERLLALVAAM